MKGKRYDILMSVITIMTVFTTLVGVSFAYFTSGISGTPENVSATTDSIGGVVFDGGVDFKNNTEIEPGWKESKTFKITVAPSSYEQTIYVKMDYTNGFTDLIGTVKDSDGSIVKVIDEDNGLIINDAVNEHTFTLVQKTFPASTEVQEVTYTMTMELPNKDTLQNYDQKKTFDAVLYADFGDKDGLYYNALNPNGTNKKPIVE